MRLFGGGEHEEIERELCAARPEAHDEFVQTLARRTRRPAHVRLGWRLGLAGTLTAALLVAVATVGGASTVSPAVHLGSLMKSAVSNGNGNGNAGGNSANASSVKKSSGSESSASNQYKFLVCHHPPGNPGNFITLSVGSQAAVNAHVANHPGDHPGACTANG